MYYVLSYIIGTDPEFTTLDEAIAFATECDDPDIEVYKISDDNTRDVVWPPL